MGLNEIGRTGAQVNLTADSKWGITSQNPESMLHSMAGLETGGDGSTAYGQRFPLVGRHVQTGTGDSTINWAAADAPFKFRVLGGRVTCLNQAADRTKAERGGLSFINLSQGASSVLSCTDCGGMQVGETRKINLNTLGNDVVAANGSLRCVADSVLPVQDVSSTWELLVELDCLRVI